MKYLKNLPEDIDKVQKLLAHEVGGRWAKTYLNKSYIAFYYRRKNFIKNYYFFYHLSNIKLKSRLKDIFNEIGYWKNGNKKREFRIFEYIWDNPFYYSYEVAKEFKVTDVYVRSIKKRYLDRMEKYAEDEDMLMLLYYFDKCVFKPGGMGKKSTIIKRKAKEKIEK